MMVTVVGGGIAGLLVAYDLADAGIEVTLLEASERLGGQVHAMPLGGHEIDLGAESFATRSSEVRDVIADLGLGGDIVTPTGAPAWVHHGPGDAYPLPADAVLGVPASPWAADVRRAIGLRGVTRAALDALIPGRAPSETATLGEVVARRMGPHVVDRLVDPVVRGVFSADAHDLPLARISPGLAREFAATRRLSRAVRRVRAAAPSGAQVAAVRGGMARLAAALADGARSRGAILRTGARVESPADLEGEVVIAAAGLAAPVTAHRDVTVVAASVTGLGDPPRGSGVLVTSPPVPGRARSMTHSSAKWPWLAPGDGEADLLRLTYEGERVPTREEVQRDVRELTGVSGAVVGEFVTKTWRRVVSVGPMESPALVVGEASGRSGLSAIVPHARHIAASLVAQQKSGSNEKGREQ